MSLNELEEYLNKTEAVTQYEQTRKEKTTIDEQLKEAQDQLSKYRQLTVQLDGKETTIEKLLKTSEEHASRFCAEEIRRKAHEKFIAEKPTLVAEELERNLNLPINEMPKTLRDLLEKKIGEGIDQILVTPQHWPQWFQHQHQQYIDQSITEGLNQAFRRKVQEAIQKAKREEWPKFLESYVQERITPLVQSSLIDQILKPTLVRKTCDRCGTKCSWQFSSEHIAEVIRASRVGLDCQNPECRDWFRRHMVTVTLGDVVLSIVEPPSPF